MNQEIKTGRTPGTRSAPKDEYFELISKVLEVCSYVKNGTINKNCDNCPAKKRCNALYDKHILQRPGRNLRPLDVVSFVSAFGPLMKTVVKK